VKSKIALDDTLDGSRIQAATDDSRVTLTGTEINDAQRRALDLSRETEGVSTAVDHRSVGTANYSSVRTYSLPLIVNALIHPSFSPAGSFHAGEILKL